MKSRALVPLLLLALLALALWALWWRPGQAPDAGGPAGTGAHATGATLPAVEHVGPATAPAAEGAGRGAGARSERAGDARFVVLGSILPDPRLPLLGASMLAYRGQPSDRRQDFGSLLDEGLAGGPGGQLRELPEMALEGEPLARAPVDAQGNFALRDLPTRHVRLALDHTHHSLQAVMPAHVPEGSGSFDVGPLRTTLGALVRGRWLAPDPPKEIELALGIDPMGVMRDRTSFFALLRGRSRAKAKVEADGSFEFRAVLPSPFAVVWGVAAGRGARHEPFPLVAGETREIVLRPHGLARLTVTVRDTKGQPLPGVRVSVAPGEADDELLRSRAAQRERSDAEGRVRFADLMPGRTGVDCARDGYLPGDQTVDLAEGQEHSIEVQLSEGAAIEGVVVDPEGKPVADAGIEVGPSIEVPFLGDVTEGEAGRAMARSALESKRRSDAEGRFRVTGLTAGGKFLVVAAHRDYVGGVARGVRAGARGVRVTLERGLHVTGRVIDAADQAPLRTFRVELRTTMMGMIDRAAYLQEFRDVAEGAFRMGPVAAGKVTLRVRAEGYGHLDQKLTLKSDTEVDVGTLALPRACAVAGKVVDAAGAPVAGAAVRRKLDGMAETMAAFGVGTGGAEVLTDREGRFTIEDLPPGRLTVVAEKDGYASANSGRLELTAGQRLGDVVLRLSQGGTIRGRLLLPEGVSLRGWEITAQQLPMGGGQRGATPDAEGRFEVRHLDPGQYQVTALDMDRFSAVQRENMSKLRRGGTMDIGKVMQIVTENSVQATVRLEAEGVAEVELDGRDRTPEGAHLVIQVRIGDAPAADGFLEVLHLESQNVLSAIVEQGRAVVRGLKPGNVRLTLRSGQFFTQVGTPQTFPVPEKGSGEIVLQLPGGRVAGRVLDDRSGEPLEGALVRLVPAQAATTEGLGPAFAIADAQGHFAFRGVAEGRYSVVADEALAAGGDGRSGGRLEGLRVAPGESLEGLVLRARPAAMVQAKVLDPVGRPVRGAWCLAADRDGKPVGTLGMAISDAQGIATFAGLPAGPLRVAARADGFAPAVSEVRDALAGEDVEFEIRLGDGPEVSVRVEDRRGRPLPALAISARFGGGPWLPAIVLGGGKLADGSIALGRLPPGEVELRLERGGQPPQVVRRTIPHGARVQLNLTLD